MKQRAISWGAALIGVTCCTAAWADFTVQPGAYADGTVLNGFITSQHGVMLRAEGAGLALSAVFSRKKVHAILVGTQNK